VSGSIMSMFEQYGQNIVRGSPTPVQIQDEPRSVYETFRRARRAAGTGSRSISPHPLS